MTIPSRSEPEGTPRPYPCPGCGSTKGSTRVGNFRSHCLNCNSSFSNVEFGLPNLDDSQES